MAASFTFSESYGASSGADNAHISLLATDAASGADDTTAANANPVVIPASSYAYSFERWIRGHWSGSFTSITALKMWRYAGTLTGSIKIKALVKTSVATTYAAPITTTSTFAGTTGNEGTTTNDLAYAASTTAPGGALSPAFNAASLGTPAQTNSSDYIVMQLVIPSGSASGNTTVGLRFGWNEV
jgi:hypothetical protein